MQFAMEMKLFVNNREVTGTPKILTLSGSYLWISWRDDNNIPHSISFEMDELQTVLDVMGR